MQPEFPEYVTNPEVVRELIKDFMVSGHYPLFKFPFKLFGDIRDFEMVFKNKGATLAAKCKTGIFGDVGDSSWPVVKSSEILDKKRFLTVLSEDEQTRSDAYLRDKVNRVYIEMAWVLVDQICDKFFKEIKANSSSTEFKRVTNKFSKWDKTPCDVLQQLKDLKSFVENEKLGVIFVSERKYYEFWDHVTTDDDEVMPEVMPEVKFNNTKRVCKICERSTYIKDLDLWLVGIDGNEFVPDGAIIGVCSHFGLPVVEILYGLDPDFGQKSDECPSTDTKDLLKNNIPLCINIFKGGSEDEEKENEAVKDRITIEAWLDFVVHVKYPNGVFYLEDVI